MHIDAHSDTNDVMLGERIAHGTPFRRAMEEGCLVGNKVIQIGLRGSGYSFEDFDWAKQQVGLPKNCEAHGSGLYFGIDHCRV